MLSTVRALSGTVRGLSALLLFLNVNCLAAAEPPAAAAIRGVLDAQAAAWNAGDIRGFMRHYWNSEQLTFSAGGKTTRGWQATLDRYERRYQPGKMGQLEFGNLEIQLLNDDHALVLGTWQLQQPDQRIGGNFSLVFRKNDDGWVIIHDHTSQLEPVVDEDQ